MSHPGALGDKLREAQLPDAPNRETVQRICSACHPAHIVLGRGMTREQWGSIVSNMISRGAKGSDEEFAEVVDYLAKNLPPAPASSGKSKVANAKAARPPSLIDQAGANDKQVVDEDAAARGKDLYTAQCITCHGPGREAASVDQILVDRWWFCMIVTGTPSGRF